MMFRANRFIYVRIPTRVLFFAFAIVFLLGAAIASKADEKFVQVGSLKEARWK